jgi:hypothetical protein
VIFGSIDALGGASGVTAADGLDAMLVAPFVAVTVNV